MQANLNTSQSALRNCSHYTKTEDSGINLRDINKIASNMSTDCIRITNESNSNTTNIENNTQINILFTNEQLENALSLAGKGFAGSADSGNCNSLSGVMSNSMLGKLKNLLKNTFMGPELLNKIGKNLMNKDVQNKVNEAVKNAKSNGSKGVEDETEKILNNPNMSIEMKLTIFLGMMMDKIDNDLEDRMKAIKSEVDTLMGTKNGKSVNKSSSKSKSSGGLWNTLKRKAKKLGETAGRALLKTAGEAAGTYVGAKTGGFMGAIIGKEVGKDIGKSLGDEVFGNKSSNSNNTSSKNGPLKGEDATNKRLQINVMFQELKALTDKRSQLYQTVANTTNAMHKMHMSAIRNIAA